MSLLSLNLDRLTIKMSHPTLLQRNHLLSERSGSRVTFLTVADDTSRGCNLAFPGKPGLLGLHVALDSSRIPVAVLTDEAVITLERLHSQTRHSTFSPN